MVPCIKHSFMAHSAIATVLMVSPTQPFSISPTRVVKPLIPEMIHARGFASRRASSGAPLRPWTAGIEGSASPEICRPVRRRWCSRPNGVRLESGATGAEDGARGVPQGNEGIADLQSLDNPASEKHYGDDNALQYGVSSAAAGPADHFFSTDTRIVFGINALEIGLVELHEMGLKRALIVTGWNQARADPILWELLPRGFELEWHSVSAEPSLSDVAEGASIALNHRADCVIAMGGAAVIDAGKVVAAIAYANKDPSVAAKRLLAAAGKPRNASSSDDDDGEDAAPLLGPIPFVAIPLVAGVGSEVNPLATILDDKDPLEPKKVTVGFQNTAAAIPAPFMAIVEPRLMMRIPLETAWPRAFVALAGCLEGYVAGRGFVPDLLSHQGIERISRCLAKDLGFRGPLYPEREDIAFSGIIRGLVVSRARWGVLHGLASAVSIICGAPYAVCVARLFPRVLEAQIASMRVEEENFARCTRAGSRARGRDRKTRTRVTPPPNAAAAALTTTEEVDDDQDSDANAGGVTNDDVDLVSVASAVLSKYRRAAVFVTGDVGAMPEAIAPWLDARLLDKNVPPLCRLGLRPEHVSRVIAEIDNGIVVSVEGLKEADLRLIVEGEASRGERQRGVEEAVGAVQGRTQTGPWQKR